MVRKGGKTSGVKVGKKKSARPVKLGVPRKRAQSAPPAGESIGSLRSMMQKMDARLSSYPKGGFADKGEQMGAKFGTLGRLAGRGLGAGLSAISGYGNYAVKKNSLSKVSASVDMVPQFVKNEHSIRVVHREFISDVRVPTNPTDFNVFYAQKINPGNSQMFPWLAKMARQYSQYKIHGMVFTFKTMTSDYSANGPLGTIMMATNYDAIERVYNSKIELENSEFAVSCKPSESLIHAIECDPKYSTLDMLYVRDSSYDTSDTSDRRFFDFGTFQLATSGLPGTINTTMGEFWVSYDIELCKPIVGGDAAVPTLTARTVISTPSGVLAVSPLARQLNIYWAGNSYNPAAGESLPIGPTSASLAIYGGDTSAIGLSYALDLYDLKLLASGKYIITYSMTGTVTGGTSFRLALENTLLTSCKPTFVANGAAVSTAVTPFETTLSDDQLGFVPDNCGGLAGTKCTYQGSITVTVTGIPVNDTSGLNYVRVTPPNYTQNSLTKINTLLRRVDLEYICFGTNVQSPTFVL